MIVMMLTKQHFRLGKNYAPFKCLTKIVFDQINSFCIQK